MENVGFFIGFNLELKDRTILMYSLAMASMLKEKQGTANSMEYY